MKHLLQLCKILLVSLVLLPGSASANMVTGEFLGVFSGNDSEASILSDLGFDVTQLAKVDTPATSNDGLVLSSIVLNDDDEPISGQWDYSGLGIVDLLVVKAGPNYAVYRYNDFITNSMPNTGLWDTAALSNKGMSHITAYQLNAVPLPASIWLFGSGLLGFIGLARKKSAYRC